MNMKYWVVSLSIVFLCTSAWANRGGVKVQKAVPSGRVHFTYNGDDYRSPKLRIVYRALEGVMFEDGLGSYRMVYDDDEKEILKEKNRCKKEIKDDVEEVFSDHEIKRSEIHQVIVSFMSMTMKEAAREDIVPAIEEIVESAILISHEHGITDLKKLFVHFSPKANRSHPLFGADMRKREINIWIEMRPMENAQGEIVQMPYVDNEEMDNWLRTVAGHFDGQVARN